MKWGSINDEGVPTFYVSYGMSPIPRTTIPFFYLHLRRAFFRILRQWGRPDVIHTQDGYGYQVLRAFKSFKIPVVISQHSTAFMERTVNPSTLRRAKWAFSQAVRVFPANKFAQQDYEPYGLHPRITWLPNALDTQVFYPSDERKEPWLLHASGFTEVKRFPDIVKAFRKVRLRRPNAMLKVVGDGARREAMETFAVQELPAGSFQFYGSLSKPDLAALMRRASGFVFASEAETFGCVLMEAMACGCPVLTTRIGGIPAVVRTGEGLFFDVGDINEMATSMCALLDGCHELDMGRISQATRERFALKTVGRILHEAHVSATRESAEFRKSEKPIAMAIGGKSH
jgi:glycosyltransferase involved in cell wall biosynthesis